MIPRGSAGLKKNVTASIKATTTWNNFRRADVTDVEKASTIEPNTLVKNWMRADKVVKPIRQKNQLYVLSRYTQDSF